MPHANAFAIVAFDRFDKTRAETAAHEARAAETGLTLAWLDPDRRVALARPKDAAGAPGILRRDTPAGPVVLVALPIRAGAGDEARDAETMMEAWLAHGAECLTRGGPDMSLVVWDGRDGSIFAARDRLGRRRLFHTEPPATHFAVGDDFALMRALAGPALTPSARHVAGFVVGVATDCTSTSLNGLTKLAPARRLLLAPDAALPALATHWTLDAKGPYAGADSVTRFRELFADAVRKDTEGRGQVAAMLSGGLDSSSVACVAARQFAEAGRPPLPVLSVVFDKSPEHSERPWIEAVLRDRAMTPHFVSADDHDPLHGFSEALDEQEGLFHGPGLILSKLALRAGREAGFDIILDGHGGDEVVTYGFRRLSKLARRRQWGALWHETRGASSLLGKHSRLREFFTYALGNSWQFQRLRRAIRERTGVDVMGWAGNSALGAIQAPRAFLNDDFIEANDIAGLIGDYWKAYHVFSGDEQVIHAADLSAPNQALGRDMVAMNGAAEGLDIRFPFFDVALMEHCVSLPVEDKMRDGWTRWIMRTAMEGILPPEVQWRRNKLEFSIHLGRGLLRHNRAFLDAAIVDDAFGLGRHFKMEPIRQAWETMKREGDGAGSSAIQPVWQAAALAVWLRKF